MTLLERYPALGGLASGGMVLVLDDMANGTEISVTGIVSEYVERLGKMGLVVVPPEQAREMTAQAEPEPEEPKERLSVQAARVILSLAVVVGLALLVYWLLGQSQ